MPSTTVAIIGGGPKGMYGLERLLAEWQTMPVSHQLEVHIFNRADTFGASEVYQTELPDFLLMNVCNEEINIWLNDALPPPFVPAPIKFVDWLAQKNESAEPQDYSPRALVGQYIKEGFEAILANLPPHVVVKKIIGEVEKVQSSKSGYHVLMAEASKNENQFCYDHVLLATGHPKKVNSDEEKHWLKQTKDRKGSRYIDSVHPNLSSLNKVSANAKVAVKGMGLAAIDAILMLTEGRGGHFKADNNQLTYLPSGDEPSSILPFSRTGVPMRPRGQMTPSHLLKPPRFFTQKAIDNIKHRVDSKLDFEQHLYPLFCKEAELAYFEIICRNYGYYFDPETINSYEEFSDIKEKFRTQYPLAPELNLKTLFNPLGSRAIESPDEHHTAICELLWQNIEEAEKGPDESPVMAVSEVWRKIVPVFTDIYNFGGLEPQSQERFTNVYWPQIARLTFGPPTINAKKIYALAEAGIVRFDCGTNPTIQFNEETKYFKLSHSFNKKAINTEYLIDARIPKNNINQLQTGLLSNLLKQGEIRSYKNGSRSKVSFEPGCIEVNELGYAIDSEDSINRFLAATGTPTEGITFDNDALSPKRNNLVSKWAKDIKENVLTNISKTSETSLTSEEELLT